MAFKEKLDKGSGEFFSFKEYGDQITGFYLGTFDHTGEWGPTKKHLFRDAETGAVKSVVGQAQLTALLTDENDPVPVGALVQVTYKSDRKGRKGNPTKIYSVAIDDEQRLDPSEVGTYAEAANEPEAYEDEPTEVEEEETPMDEVKTAPARSIAAAPAKTAAAPPKTISADAKKRAQEILSRRKTA